MKKKLRIVLMTVTALVLIFLIKLYCFDKHKGNESLIILKNKYVIRKNISPSFAIEIIKMSTSGLMSYEGQYSCGTLGQHHFVDIKKTIPELTDMYHKSDVILWGYEFIPEMISKKDNNLYISGIKGEKEAIYFFVEKQKIISDARWLFCESNSESNQPHTKGADQAIQLKDRHNTQKNTPF